MPGTDTGEWTDEWDDDPAEAGPLTQAQRFARSRPTPTRRGGSAAWVYDTVRAGLREGFYERDHVFSERQLMQFFNVTRASVRDALERLTEEGLLNRTPKRGTSPRGGTVHVTVGDDVSVHVFGSEIPELHEEVVTASEVVSASIFVATRLDVPEGTAVRVDESIVTVAGSPFAVCMLYSRVGEVPEHGMAGVGSYPSRVAALGFDIASIDSTFEAIGADAVSAARLLVPESAPLLLRTLTFVADDGSRLLSIIRMRGDKTVVHTERRPGHA